MAEQPRKERVEEITPALDDSDEAEHAAEDEEIEELAQRWERVVKPRSDQQ